MVTKKNVRIGQIIRSLRKSRDWKLRDLAERIDKSVGFISDIERGRGHFSFKTLQDIANVFEVPVYKLTGEKAEEGDTKEDAEEIYTDLLKLRDKVKAQPAIYMDNRELSKESRLIFEEFLDMVVDRENKKRQKKTPHKHEEQ